MAQKVRRSAHSFASSLVGIVYIATFAKQAPPPEIAFAIAMT
jgi:hypothetical protein